MDTGRVYLDAETLNNEVQAIWEQNAPFWDEYMGEGNQFQHVLIQPAVERLLDLKSGEIVLDVACGNGAVARHLAQLGAQVVACDFSQTFINRALERSSEYATRIEFKVIDATNQEQLLALGVRRFDAVYCGMAIQDMPEIDPLFSAVRKLLKPGGRFIFSIPHPAFNNSYIRRVVEEEDRQGEIVVQHNIKITGYIQPRTDRGLGIIGQPIAQYYFHRPISQVYSTAFQNGFILDGIEEPVFGPEDEGKRPFSWANFRGIPPVLVSRMRLAYEMA